MAETCSCLFLWLYVNDSDFLEKYFPLSWPHPPNRKNLPSYFKPHIFCAVSFKRGQEEPAPVFCSSQSPVHRGINQLDPSIYKEAGSFSLDMPYISFCLHLSRFDARDKSLLTYASHFSPIVGKRAAMRLPSKSANGKVNKSVKM